LTQNYFVIYFFIRNMRACARADENWKCAYMCEW